MSVRVMSAVWDDQEIRNLGELLVLLALADHADDRGFCYPSMARIAEKARMNERSARRICRRLETSGRLEKEANSGGRNRTNRFRVIPQKPGPVGPPLESLNPDPSVPLKTRTEGPPVQNKTRTLRAETRTEGALNPDPSVPRTIKNHQEPSEERKSAREVHWAIEDLIEASGEPVDMFWLDVLPKRVSNRRAWGAALARAQKRRWQWSNLNAIVDEYERTVKTLTGHAPLKPGEAAAEGTARPPCFRCRNRSDRQVEGKWLCDPCHERDLSNRDPEGTESGPAAAKKLFDFGRDAA
jgi:Helix-turn-helix domain